MLIKADIVESSKQALTHRLSELKRLTAPVIIIRNVEKQLTDLEAGIKFQGDFAVEFVERSVKTGRGGKRYIAYKTADGKTAYYFPNGCFGPFVKWEGDSDDTEK